MRLKIPFSSLTAIFILLTASLAWADDPASAAGNNDQPSPSPATSQEQVVVDYSGRLQDEKGSPVSGIFELRFKLLKSEDSAKATWAENRYVAIVDGKYELGLGERRKLRKRQIPDDPWIAVELVGEGEIVRDRFEFDAESEPVADEPSKGSRISQETKDLLEKAANDNSIAFADVAQRAVKADTAATAETAQAVGDLSAKEIKELSNVALERLGEHIADPSAHEAAGGIRIGNERQITNSAGGSGGSNYELKCPKGYVVTGIRGGAGRLVDSLSLICQPLR